MGLSPGITALAAVILLAAPANRGELDALERAVQDGCSERSRLVDERAGRMREAALLADRVAELRGGKASLPSADKNLEGVLKQFDHLARRLDEIDRRISDQDRTIAMLKRKFESAANAADAQLGGGLNVQAVGEIARAHAAIDMARKRVAKLGVAEAAFRPVLEVAASPDDDATELQQKVDLLEAERDRVQRELVRLDADARVLAARILIKERLAKELEMAARTAGSDLAVLRRESDNVGQALHDLDVERAARAQRKGEIGAAFAQVTRHLDEIRGLLEQRRLGKGNAP